MLRHVALAKEGGFFGVEADGEVVEREFVREAFERFSVADRGECVVGDQRDEGVVLGLIFHMALHGTEIVAEVRFAAGLDAGEDAHEYRI